MVDDADPPVSLGDLRVLANTAAWMLDEVDRLRSEVGAPELSRTKGSEAEAESHDDPFGAYAQEVLSYCDMLIAASFDQFAALLQFAVSALHGSQTPAFAPLTIARSAVGMNATAYWLQEPNLGANARAARLLSLERAELRYQARFDPSTSQYVKDLEQEAESLGLVLVGRGDRAGFGAETPSRSDRVLAVTDDPAIYVMMSSASHGAMWALMSLYSIDEPAAADGQTLVLRKSPPVAGVYSALVMAMTTTAITLQRESVYRGWPVERLDAILQTAMNSVPAR